MCRLRENGEQPAGADRREFCRLGGNLALGMIALTSVPAIASEAGRGAEVPAPADPPNGGSKMADSKVTAVTAKVISVKGECGFGHKAGDTVRISESGVEGKICIHALYSMFPAAFAMLYDAKFPWLQDPDRKTHPCTDAANPVVFELTKIRT